MKYSNIVYILIIIISIFLSSNLIFSQEEDKGLKETLQDLSEDVAKRYVSPLSSAFGSNLNSGWFHKAPKAKIFGLDVELGVVVMASMFPNNSRSFSTGARFRFNEEEARELIEQSREDIEAYVDETLEDEYGFISDETKEEIMAEIENHLVQEITSQYQDVSVSGATIIGNPDDSMKVNFSSQTITYDTTLSYYGVDYRIEESFNVPDQSIVLPIAGLKELADAGGIPMAVPQLKIGTLYGTRATLRFKIPIKDSNYNELIRYVGFGIQHNPAVWFKGTIPFSIAASYFTQKLEIGDIFKVRTNSFGINVSKQIGWRFLNLTPYIGYMYENASMEVTYEYIIETPITTITEPINFKLISENKSRFTAGLNIRFLIININADYNWAKYNSLSVGLNIAI